MSLSALFVTSSLIGIGNFIDGLFADQTDKTNVRVGVGLNGYVPPDGGDPLETSEGRVGSIQTLDQNEDLLGLSDSFSIGSGDYTDVGVEQPNKEQAAFVELFADNDEVCIAYVSTTWVDGTKWMWVGDWGNPCGLTWYYSGITAGTEEDGSGHLTQCTWLDADNTVTAEDTTTAGALKIGVSTYGNEGLVGGDPKQACGAPMLSAYSDSDGATSVFKRDPSGPSMPKRVNKKRVPDQRAVVSPHPASQHNATYLCEHSNSHGPDFISLDEGKACDMDTRTVLDICTDDITSDCYSTETHSVIAGKKRSAKTYSEIIEW